MSDVPDLTELPSDISQIVETLDQDRVREIQKAPNLETLENLAGYSEKCGREVGIQILYLSDTTSKTVYTRGLPASISCPYSRGHAAVFFHTHPPGSINYHSYSHIALSPSFIPGANNTLLDAGDFVATNMSRRNGGYLNMLSSGGLALCVNRFRQPESVNDRDAPYLYIRSGEYAGNSIVDNSPEELDKDLVGQNLFLSFRARVPQVGEDFEMLFLTFDALRQTEVSFHDLCFGTGLAKVMGYYDLKDIRHQRNLWHALMTAPEEPIV